MADDAVRWPGIEAIAKRTGEQAELAFPHDEHSRYRYAAGYSEGAAWGYDAGSAATLALVVQWLRQSDLLVHASTLAAKLEHGALDRAGEVESHDG